MILLAIDTSAEQCAVCLYDGERETLLAQISDHIGRGHAERLMPMMAECLEKANLDYNQISRIAVTIGPGSFTGVRVGMAAARGLALSLHIPVSGISTLDLCLEEAQSMNHDGSIAAIIDARRNEAYIRIDDNDPFISAYENIPNLLQADQVAICGSGAEILNETTGKNYKILHRLSAMPIETMCQMAMKQEQKDIMPEPLYLRSADAKSQSGFTLQRV